MSWFRTPTLEVEVVTTPAIDETPAVTYRDLRVSSKGRERYPPPPFRVHIPKVEAGGDALVWVGDASYRAPGDWRSIPDRAAFDAAFLDIFGRDPVDAEWGL